MVKLLPIKKITTNNGNAIFRVLIVFIVLNFMFANKTSSKEKGLMNYKSHIKNYMALKGFKICDMVNKVYSMLFYRCP
ncbi:hypothetical protein GCM10009430_21480 [Aquimarina litoralis]|uniref:Uncharacterized protein n=1 Tax=Aquimarina litoralis TaxID=584605 RepID=A0ABP3TYM1_9FLAO